MKPEKDSKNQNKSQKLGPVNDNPNLEDEVIEEEPSISIKLRSHWPEGIRRPNDISEADTELFKAAQDTLRHGGRQYDLAFKTNRSLEAIYDVHQVHIRALLADLAELLPADRPYIRVLDIGCGEGFFSVNVFTSFSETHEDPLVNFAHDQERPAFTTIIPEKIPALEMRIDNGQFNNSAVDTDGLWSLDIADKKDRELFSKKIPAGYFDFIISTAAIGAVGTDFESWYIPASKEIFQWVESFVNPDHGVFLLATADYHNYESGIPGVSSEYASPVVWSAHGSDEVGGLRTSLSKKLNIEEYHYPSKERIYDQAVSEQDNHDLPKVLARTLPLFG